MNGRERILVVGGLLALAISQAALGSELSVSNDWVKLAWEEKTGSYQIICQDRGWEFSGKLPSGGPIPPPKRRAMMPSAPIVR